MPLARSARCANGLNDILGVVDVAAWADHDTPSLPYGIAKLAELARALAGEPKLILLDEPAAGLNTREKARLGEVLLPLQRRFGFSAIVVEHDLGLVMSLCHKIVVLNFGRVIAHGTPDEIKRDPDVIAAYLGAGHHA